MFIKRLFQTKMEDSVDQANVLADELAEQAKRFALRQLFRQAQFNQCDGLNEYAEGYNTFNDRGDVIPYEMQQALKRQEALTDGQTAVAGRTDDLSDAARSDPEDSDLA
ncbi:MAG: DUF3306 domain-containing protein [Gammaproteobacteria bacterium]